MSEPTPDQALAQAFETAFQLHRAGQLEAAEAGYRALLLRWPTYVPALGNLGVILSKKGLVDEAIRTFTIALAADPNHADSHYNLGNLYRRGNDPMRAAAAYRECVQVEPNHSNAYFNLGLVCSTLGQLNDAEEAFRAVLRIEPGAPEARLHLGDILLRTARIPEGILIFQAYVEQFPSDPRGMYNYGLALANAGQAGTATEWFHKALKLKPKYAEAHNALGLALEILGRKDDAVYHYEQAVKEKPELADAWSNLGTNLTEQGLGQEAEKCVRQSQAVRPNAPAVHSNLLLLLNYSSRYTPEQVRDEHLLWAERFASPVSPSPRPHEPHDPERKLRIGYVSADFRTHPVGAFLEMLLTHHDRDEFTVFAYPQEMRSDATTERLRQLADHWRPITGVNDREAAEQIDRDGIDVLIDLSGHTAGNRLMTFAYRPAAVQATVFAYPNTTGIGAMDYRITDPVSDPPGATEHLYSEQLLHLPDVAWIYPKPLEAPPVGPLPAAGKKQFTFGCLNNAAKISDDCLELWANLVRSVVGAKLIVLTSGAKSSEKRLTDRFVKAGILRERLQLVARLPRDRYFEMYNSIDMALDPFPYNGGVTTCDALWMGVPVLTLGGTNYASRQGVMQLLQMDLSEFVADSPQTLIDLAKMWTSKRTELAVIRAGLRDRLAASPLMDAAKYVRNLEAAVRAAWVKRLVVN